MIECAGRVFKCVPSNMCYCCFDVFSMSFCCTCLVCPYQYDVSCVEFVYVLSLLIVHTMLWCVICVVCVVVYYMMCSCCVL